MSHETQRYAPFVETFNHAFEELSKLDIQQLPLRGESDLQVTFHRNDPSLIYGNHKDEVSERKPDVVITSLETVKKVSNDPTAQFSDYTMVIAPQAPEEKFMWPDVLTSLEFKLRQNHLGPVPASFVVESFTEVKHQTMEQMRKELENIEEAEAAEQQQPNASTSAKNSEGAGVVVRSTKLLTVPCSSRCVQDIR